MVCLNPGDELSNEYSKHDDRSTNNCQNCEQTSRTDPYFKTYQRKLQEDFEYALHRQNLLIQKLKSLISQLSADALFDSIEQIFELKMKSNEIEETANKIQQQLITITNESKANQDDSLQNGIRRLKKDIKQLKLKLEEINNNSEIRVSEPAETIKSPLADIASPNRKIHLSADDGTLGESIKQRLDYHPVLSHLLLNQMSPSIIDLKENELDLTAIEDERYLGEEEEPVKEFISSDTAAKINQKVHLSNNIVGLMRGPVKVMVDSTMHAAEAFAKAKHASGPIVEAVNKGLARQKQTAMEERTSNNSIMPVFAEITSDWIFEGENIDKGFSSASIWMRNPQGDRILVKTQDLPICAANEWLAYALGRQMGLSVNKVQIAIYEKDLVTLHTDVNQGDEKTITLLDLPRRIRKTLMTDPIMGSMDLFDRLIQNADRNPRNIVITAPDTTDTEYDTARLKIHLIDHGACFGMGKLNGLSVMASKLRSHHLAVVKFDPIAQAKKFDQYLSKLSPDDRILMGKTLNRLAAITDNQIDSWLNEVEDFLTSSQYTRIYNVLYRQRDIARRHAIQWGIYPRSLSVKSKEGDQFISETSDTNTYF